MKRIGIGMLCLALSLALALPAVAEDNSWWNDAVSSVETWAAEGGELEVRGRAVRTVEPDTVTIRVGARVEAEDERDAQTQTNTIINDVLASLRALGVEDSQMSTSGYNITRKYRYVGRISRPSGYEASISLTVTVQDFDLINSILDIAVEKGANDVSGISFSYSDEGAVYRQALQDAIEAAKTKAQAMADTAGVTLYTLLRMYEGSQGGAYYNSYTLEAMEAPGASADSGTQIMAGEVEISANVTMVYRIK